MDGYVVTISIVAVSTGACIEVLNVVYSNTIANVVFFSNVFYSKCVFFSENGIWKHTFGPTYKYGRQQGYMHLCLEWIL